MAANRVAILVRHDDVGDDHVGRVFRELPERRGRIRASDHVNILAAKCDLDDFAHGGAVIDKINGRRFLDLRFAERRHGDYFAHWTSSLAMARSASSVLSNTFATSASCASGTGPL